MKRSSSARDRALRACVVLTATVVAVWAGSADASAAPPRAAAARSADHAVPVQAAPPAGTNTAPPSQASAVPREFAHGAMALTAEGLVGTPAATAARPQATPLTRTSGSPPSGIVPFHQQQSFQLDGSTKLSVDLVEGNLALAQTDENIAGVGQALQVTRTWNSSFADGNGFGKTWTGSYGPGRVAVSGGSWYPGGVQVANATGALLNFPNTGTDTWSGATGWDAGITSSDGKTFTVTYHHTGEVDTYSPVSQNGGLSTLTKVVDRNGDETDVTFGSGNSYTVTDKRSGRSVTFADGGSNIADPTATDSAGRVVHYAYNGSDELTSATDAAGDTTSYGYDSSGRLTSVTTPDGHQALIGYDSENRATSVTRVTSGGTGPTTTFAYSSTSVIYTGTTKVTDPDGHTTTYNHDNGDVTSTTDALGDSRSTSYDSNHNLTSAVDAMGAGSTAGNTSTFTWDANNNLTSAKEPVGATTSLAYQQIAGAYLPSTLTDSRGDTTSFGRDATGNLLTASDTTKSGTGAKLTYTYQGDSGVSCGGFTGQKCSSTDADNNKTTYAYDSHGDLTTATPPAPAGKTTYTYDNLGRVTSVTDGRGVTTHYGYDSDDRITSVTAGSSTVSLGYDRDGNLTSQTDASGTTTHTYNALDAETSRTLGDGHVTSLSYDATGNVTGYSDAAGTVNYGYDQDNRVTSATEPGSLTIGFGYNKDGSRTSTTFPGGTTTTVTVDAGQRPTEIKTVHSGTTLADITYTYGTNSDLIASRTDGSGTLDYTYDSQNRLTKADGSAGNNLFCYDANGNLTGESTVSGATCGAIDTSGGPTGTTFSYNADNEATSTTISCGCTINQSYDGAGDQLTAQEPTLSQQTNSWNGLAQLTSATGPASDTFTYSGTDQSQLTKVDATTIDNGQEGIDATGSGSGSTTFVRDPSGAPLGLTTSGGKNYYYLLDAQGSVVGVVDGSGNKVDTYSYTPYGQRTAGNGNSLTQPLGFTGAYTLPELGLVHMGARYYNPTAAAFDSQDPAGKGNNPYAYAGDDPINNSDPTGTSTLGGVLGAIGIGIGIGAALASGVGIGFVVGFSVAAAGFDMAGAAADGATGGQIATVGIVDAFAGMVGVSGELLGVAAKTAIPVGLGYAGGGALANAYGVEG